MYVKPSTLSIVKEIERNSESLIDIVKYNSVTDLINAIEQLTPDSIILDWSNESISESKHMVKRITESITKEERKSIGDACMDFWYKNLSKNVNYYYDTDSEEAYEKNTIYLCGLDTYINTITDWKVRDKSILLEVNVEVNPDTLEINKRVDIPWTGTYEELVDTQKFSSVNELCKYIRGYNRNKILHDWSNDFYNQLIEYLKVVSKLDINTVQDFSANKK